MALKIVYKICRGIDIHKTFVVACVTTTNKQGVVTYNSHYYSTYTKSLKELLQWLLAHDYIFIFYRPSKDGLFVMRLRKLILLTIVFQSYNLL